MLRRAKRPTLTRHDSLASRIVPNPHVVEKVNDDGVLELSLPVRPARWTRLMGQDTGQPLVKTFRLDPMAQEVWKHCAGSLTVEQLIDRYVRQRNIEPSDSQLAWQGICLKLPAGWNPVTISGSRHKGQLRIGDLHTTTMELFWQHATRFDAAERVWRHYLKRLGIPWRLAAQELADCPMLADRLHNAGWRQPRVGQLRRGAARSIHALAQGPVSGRFVLIRFDLSGSHIGRRQVADILATLSEPPPDGPEPWSIYGLSVQLPRPMRLVRHRLQPGHLLLHFQRRSMQVIWERRTFARQILGDRDLAVWLRQYAAARRQRTRFEPVTALPGNGCVLKRASSWLDRISPLLRRSASRLAAWHNTDPDHLVVLAHHARADQVEPAFSRMCTNWKVQGNLREAEVCLMSFCQLLMRRGLIGMVPPTEPGASPNGPNRRSASGRNRHRPSR